MANPSSPSTTLTSLIRFPPVRALIGIVWVTLVVGLTQSAVVTLVGDESPAVVLLLSALGAAVGLAAYVVFVRGIEGRAATELSTSGALTELAAGLGLGALLFSATIAILWALGCFHVVGSNSLSDVVPALALSLVSGVVEELLFRGILFRITEEGVGTWLALAITALIFGLLHLANPNSSLWAALAIALEAGILLAAVYMFTRRLWMAIGLHIGWNFVQGGIYGVAVSGIPVTGLLRSTLDGPDLITGGRFGVEASIFAVLVCLAASVFFLRKTRLKGEFVKPMWSRRG